MNDKSKRMRPTTALAAVVCAGITCSPGALASDEWEFALSPLFLWGLSIDGDATINDQEAPLDLEFKDEILDNMEAVFTLHFEARRDEWGFFVEYQYVDLEPEVEASGGPFDANVDIDFEETVLELGGTWAFHRSGETRWELLGGARYTDQDINTDIAISSVLPGDGRNTKLEGGDDWWHALAGVRVFHQLGEKWTFIARTDYGYGDSDNTAFNFAFQFDYRFNEWGSAFIGARYLDYDYEEENNNVVEYAFDAAKQGPLAGVTIHW